MISWNVAGLRSCLKKGFADFFQKINADVICLQEAKITDSELNFRPEGYEIYLNSAMKKGYSGTLIYTRKTPLNVTYGMNMEIHDQEGRMITLEFENFYLITLYTPNSKRGLLRLEYRLQWEDDFLNYIKNLEKQKPVIFCGDLNVAHQEIDIKNPKTNERNAGFTKEERDKFTRLLESGYIDTYRYLNPNKVMYTWWSYFANARERNIGWRLDYFVISKKLVKNMKDAYVYNGVLGSDHCPIGLNIEMEFENENKL